MYKSSIILKTLSFTLFVLLCYSTSFAQDTTTVKPIITTTTYKIQRHAISTNGIGIIGLVAPTHRNDLTYEFALNQLFTLSADIEGGVYSSGQTTSGTGAQVMETYKLSGWGFGVEARIYPVEKQKIAPRGLFTGLYYKHYFLQEKFKSYDVTTVDDNHQAWGVGLDFGYKIGKKNFMFEPLVGYAINWNNGVGSNPNLDSFYAGDDDIWTIFLRVEARLGVVF